MLSRWLLYGLALLAAFLLKIYNEFYPAHLIFLICLSLPLLSLLLSLPAVFGCRVSVLPSVHSVMRGGDAQFQVIVRSPSFFPLARLSFRVSIQNLVTEERQTFSTALLGTDLDAPFCCDAKTTHCGRLECTVSRVRAWDYLGLFHLPLASRTASLLSLPTGLDEDEAVELKEALPEQTSATPRAGYGLAEDYDLRPYRPGDPLRSIHWKLSSKMDSLLVKETLEQDHPQLIITFDHFGSPDAMDQVFDRLDSVCRLLLRRRQSCIVQWTEPMEGAVRSFSVADESTFSDCLYAALSDPAPQDEGAVRFASQEKKPKQSSRYHITS